VQHPWFSPSVLHLSDFSTIVEWYGGTETKLSNVLPTFDNLVSLKGQIVECLPTFDNFAVHRNKIVEYPATHSTISDLSLPRTVVNALKKDAVEWNFS
jgi:hypothetical protein